MFHIRETSIDLTLSTVSTDLFDISQTDYDTSEIQCECMILTFSHHRTLIMHFDIAWNAYASTQNFAE